MCGGPLGWGVVGRGTLGWGLAEERVLTLGSFAVVVVIFVIALVIVVL